MPGTFVFKPLEANLTRSTEFLGKMDPYCAFIVGNKRINSQICKKGGKHPHWNDSITIPVSGESKIMLELMDKDKITHDDHIGSCLIDLQEIEMQGRVNRWYPLFHKNKPAGEILLDVQFDGGPGAFKQSGQEGLGSQNQNIAPPIGAGMGQGFGSPQIRQEENVLNRSAHSSLSDESKRTFVEQRQTVEPHTFLKEVDVVETRPVVKQIEVLEPHKVLKEVQYTEAVPVKKQIEIIEPHVITKEVEVIEPRLVTKQIQVIENVPIKKQVEVIENEHVLRNIETFEPQTFTKQVEVTEQVPVMKQVTVTEPVTRKKSVEFVEPIITTETITKEIQPAVIVDEKVTTEIGPASLLKTSLETNLQRDYQLNEERRLYQEKLGSGQYSSEFEGRQGIVQEGISSEQMSSERFQRGRPAQENLTGNLIGQTQNQEFISGSGLPNENVRHKKY